MAFGSRGSRSKSEGKESAAISSMTKVAEEYKTKGDLKTPVVQDFHSFRQALNVASGDQRLLVFVSTDEKDQDALRKKLSPVMGDEEIIGKFHTDFFSKDSDEQWSDSIEGVKKKGSILIIQSDQFGLEGQVLKELPIDAKPADIKAALLTANQQFAKSETRKVYSDHVSEGRKEGVFFEGGVEYGEDRDGDGVIDKRGGQGQRPTGRRGRGKSDSQGAGK